MKTAKNHKSEKVLVRSKGGKPISHTTPARARKLLKAKRAKVFGYKPLFQIQLIEDKHMNLISYEGQNSIVNLDNICRIELDGNKIMFFYVSATARDNWKFKTAEEAKEVFEAIISNSGIKKIRSK